MSTDGDSGRISYESLDAPATRSKKEKKKENKRRKRRKAKEEETREVPG